MSERDTPRPVRKTALAPDLRAMDARAIRAWTERMAVRPLGDGRYAVDSESGATYVVDLPARTCSCPDHTFRGERCKHRRRVAIEITAHRVPPPGERAVPCGACGTETFVPEREDPPHLCSHCRVEPGDVVADRETGDRLVVVAVTGTSADGYEIEDDRTVAEYPTNAEYPDDDLVIEVVYLADRARETQKQYSFPHSRLERVDDAAVVA